MADVFSPEKRSAVMALIRGKGNKSTEFRFVALLRLHGIKGWRRHLPMPGKPDFAFPKLRLAIFVDGDFWHGNRKTSRMPKTNAEFWEKKIQGNRARDRAVTRQLKAMGWRVVRVWESTLARHPVRVVARVKRALNSVSESRGLAVLRRAV